MLFEGEKHIPIDENEFLEILNYEKDSVYLYHYIVVFYNEDNQIKEIKIDQVKNLKLLEDKDIIRKYYVRKIHYFNNPDYFYSEEIGDTYHIYNIGYFHIGGYMKNDIDEKEFYKKYIDDYENLEFPFTDEDFLLNNK